MSYGAYEHGAEERATEKKEVEKGVCVCCAEGGHVRRHSESAAMAGNWAGRPKEETSEAGVGRPERSKAMTTTVQKMHIVATCKGS
jgi:antirestriction protein ArdC